MADGAVLSGIPRQMALKFSAHSMMVSGRIYVHVLYAAMVFLLHTRVLLDWCWRKDKTLLR